jgi:hypothetical protein
MLCKSDCDNNNTHVISENKMKTPRHFVIEQVIANIVINFSIVFLFELARHGPPCDGAPPCSTRCAIRA